MNALHVPEKDSRKGQNGKLLIIGGSRRYHGAAVLAVLAARRFVDLVYFYPGEKDALLIGAVKNIPEVIVIEDLDCIPDMDCVLFGVGLGQAKPDIRKITKARKLVIDGDGLKRFKGRIPKGSVITPHEGEFRFLFGIEGTKENISKMAKKNRCIILKKGPTDVICDGRTGNGKIKTNELHNPGMTKGGTGDVLGGLVAALSCKNDCFDSAYYGTLIAGNAGNMLMKKFGYNYCASDLAGMLPQSLLALQQKKKI